MKTKLTQKQIRFQALLLFFIRFFLVELCAVFLYQNQLKEAKLKADYTAQTTIGRVKSQLNHYLAESNLMKHMIEAGYTVDDEEFSVLSSLMQDDQNVIKAHELAKDGIVMSAVMPGAVAFDGSYWDKRSKDFEKPAGGGKSGVEICADFLWHHQAVDRFGTPEEIANAVLFMASEKASFMPAALIPVDGANM